MSSFGGRVILITGGTSGLGAAAAALLAARGARVVITGRRTDKGQAVVRKIMADGGEALFVEGDVTRRADVEAMVAQTLARFGRLDGAVNNAGITGTPFTQTADIDEAEWLATINTNLNAVWLCMKAEIPAMLASGGGSIVNMSSMYGLNGSDIGHAGYAASKAGVIGLTKTAAIDYGTQGIRVNALCPGFAHSEMVTPYLDSAPEFFAQAIARHSAMDRVGESDEVAEAVCWLLSEQSSFITGVALPVQGGEAKRMY